MEISVLIEKVSAQDQVKLKVLHNAVIQTTKSYKDDPTKVRLSDWNAAQAALDDTVETLKASFDEENSEQYSGSFPNWKTYTDTKNKAAVLRHLESDGWEVKKQTFYNHCASGKLAKNRNGLFTRRTVKKYAETWLVRSGSGQTVAEEGEDLLAEKTREEILRIRTTREREEFRLGKERGLYMLRSDIYLELAGRAVVLENNLRHLVQSRVPAYIAAVHGRQDRVPDLVDMMDTDIDKLLNEYATSEFQVVITESDQESLNNGDSK